MAFEKVKHLTLLIVELKAALTDLNLNMMGIFFVQAKANLKNDYFNKSSYFNKKKNT